jgi:hypothetical protein
MRGTICRIHSVIGQSWTPLIHFYGTHVLQQHQLARRYHCSNSGRSGHLEYEINQRSKIELAESRRLASRGISIEGSR